MLINHPLRIFVFFLVILPIFTFADEEIRIATWNIEWLSTQPSDRITKSFRTEDDFDTLNDHFKSMTLDVLGFQEVNGIEAIKRVVGQDYTIWLSERSWDMNRQHQFSHLNQFTGFAVHKSIAVTSKPDLQLETTAKSKLRIATYIKLHPSAGRPIHALSIHLKAGCINQYRNNRNCQRLKGQALELNKWILERELDNDRYIILGDFNHTLSNNNNWMWASISTGTNAELATRHTKPNCRLKSRKQPSKTFKYPSVIDHIVVSRQVEVQDPKQVMFKEAEVINHHLSDHCPVLTTVSK